MPAATQPTTNAPIVPTGPAGSETGATTAAPPKKTPAEIAAEPAEKPVRTVPSRELAITRVGEPEKQPKIITLSETTYKTLVDTIVLHIKAVDKLKKENRGDPAAADSAFYKFFTGLFPGENLSNPENLQRCAEKYLLGGKEKELSGLEIQTGLELIWSELASLQAALPRTFIPEGTEYRRELKSGERETHVIITEDGSAEVSSKPAGSWLEKFRKGKKVKTSIGYKIVGGKRMQIDHRVNGLLSEGQENFLQEFLRENGLTVGDLNAEQLLAFDTRITALMTASMEIYLKAGCPLAEFDPNLIKVDPQNNTLSYIDTKTAYLSGEKAMTGTENLRNVLGLEQKAIIKEIKARVEKELKEANEKSETKRAEETVESQLTGQIAKIEEKAPSPEEQKVKKAEIER